MSVFAGEDLVGDLHVSALVDECPAYDSEPARPALPIYPAPRRVLEPAPQGETLSSVLGRQHSLAPVGFEQYDCIVGSSTVAAPRRGPAVLML